MRCSRCGSELHNVPAHLAGLVQWMCQQCANTGPQRPAFTLQEDVAARQNSYDKRKQAA